MFILIILLGILLALTLVYLNGRYNENYWKKRGVTFHSKNRVMGPLWDYLTQDRALFEVFHDIYKKYPNEPAVGVGSFMTPALYVKDIQNLQHIMQTDFYAFNHRGFDINKNDLLSDNILMMHGIRWKMVRQQMSPLFTANKMKSMYYIIDKSAQDLVTLLNKEPARLKGNAYDTLNSFCCAAIGSAVFGITTESTFDSPFLKMATDAMAATVKRNFKFALSNISPWLWKVTGLNLFDDYQDFFIDAIKQVIRQREKENVKKHDFADLCVSLQRNGTIKDPETGFELQPTDELLAAQAFFYFIAGVEPCATAMFSTLIELGQQPEILQKVQKEIDEAFEKCNGKFDYDTVNGMEYLDKVLSESLRMYPPIGFSTRRCVRDTVLPVGNIKVEKGTKIFGPVFEIHHDPALYPNPEVFDPERFSQAPKLNDISYMPFGVGNRICIGMRYARLQVKAGIVYVLRHFDINTVVLKGGIRFSKQQIQVRPSNVDLEICPRKF